MRIGRRGWGPVGAGGWVGGREGAGVGWGWCVRSDQRMLFVALVARTRTSPPRCVQAGVKKIRLAPGGVLHAGRRPREQALKTSWRLLW